MALRSLVPVQMVTPALLVKSLRVRRHHVSTAELVTSMVLATRVRVSKDTQVQTAKSILVI